MANLNGRRYVEDTVTERARHTSAEQVRTTRSLAEAERLLGREYHGRFLIELLQNAADAWRASQRPGRSRLSILIIKGPTLIVANQGEPFPAKVVIDSLGQIGASTKAPGEAIGHKGIGFKSVLEVSLTPQLYSGLRFDSPELAVRFDPEDALARIRAESPAWDRLVGEIGDKRSQGIGAVPVLRFPIWVDEQPDIVQELRSQEFDTVIALPFDERFSGRLALDEAAWLKAVREGIEDVTDQILLLLGTFAEIRIEDRLAGTVHVVSPRWQDAVSLGDDVQREVVEVQRDSSTTSRWRMYRRKLLAAETLSSEIAVAMRLGAADDGSKLVPPIGDTPSAPFHLFFPTKIGSGLPLLLHGYFEVNAARTGFYEGSGTHNDRILKSLAELVATAVADTASEHAADLSSLLELLADAGRPEDPRALEFARTTLGLLDSVEWVPLARRDQSHCVGAPARLLSHDDPHLIRHVERCFPADYVLRTTGLDLPARTVTDKALAFLAGRRPAHARDFWQLLGALLRPGDQAPWPEHGEDEGFRELLSLIGALESNDPGATSRLLSELRGDPDSRLLPVNAPDGGRGFVPLPDPEAGVAGRRSQLVMARVRPPGMNPLVPPTQLDVAFIPDGLLRDETEVDRAKPLGVRPFTVDNVIDRLNFVPDDPAAAAAILRFLWQLLARERRSEFGTRSCLEHAATFDPSAWFWCQPGRPESGDAERDRQRRERFLAEVRLPARDGQWRPAGTLAFGDDWARWLEGEAVGPLTSPVHQRIAAYRVLEAIQPSHASMLAEPARILDLLADRPPIDPDERDATEGEHIEIERLNAERHAFLLRLGVWEVIPVEGFEDRTLREQRFPWDGPLLHRQQQAVEDAGGWAFESHKWSGLIHKRVFVSEDFRFRWALGAAAQRDAIAVARSLEFGTGLFSKLVSLSVFCPGCDAAEGRHRATYRSHPHDRYPSTLLIALQSERWVPAVRNGEPMASAQEPGYVWWSRKVPAGAGLLQSPLRFLALCQPDAGISEDLRRLAGIVEIDTAGFGALERVLKTLRAEFETETLPAQRIDSGSARQAFVGLHRQIYERLAEVAVTEQDEVHALLDRVLVLCDAAESVAYRSRREVRHDDGRFAAYRRHFSASVPFVVLARDKTAVANRLDLEPFVVSMTRRHNEEAGRDVTDDMADILTDRIPELLSIVVHHSLGTQTLEVMSQTFEERARRLRSLRVRQVENLIVDARVDGTEIVTTLGEGLNQDMFLEGPTSSTPVLFHDFTGENWKDQVRRRLAPHLAAILENAAYTATFALFLLADGDSAREGALQELGITATDVENIRSRLGAVTSGDRERYERWFSAVLSVQTGLQTDPSHDPEALHAKLRESGFTDEDASRLIDLGGGTGVRGDASPEGALWLLESKGLDLRALDTKLRLLGDEGLDIRVARTRLRQWVDANGRRTAAVLWLKHQSPEKAKGEISTWKAPAHLTLSLNPPTEELIAPIVTSLQAVGYAPDRNRLATEPTAELVRLAERTSVSELDALVTPLYDAEERQRMLRSAAAAWRRELLVLSVLSRVGPHDLRATIRDSANSVEQLLPTNPIAPTVLEAVLDRLFPRHLAFASALKNVVVDSLIASVPQRHELLDLASTNGVAIGHLEIVIRAIETPRREAAKRTRELVSKLRESNLTVKPPVGMHAPPPKPPAGQSGRKHVATVKVDERADRRKRQLGDEGERWALAAAIEPFLKMTPVERREAVQAILNLLEQFEGDSVEKVRAHAESVCGQDLDEEELIDELTAFLHVSKYSDGFGFDLLGWLPTSADAAPSALCLEVKSSADGTMHFSTSEWSLARRFHNNELEGEYAVLVVKRSTTGGPPGGLDLLVDPLFLEANGSLLKSDDGYKLMYRSE